VKVSGGTVKKKSTTEDTENTETSTHCNSVVFSVSSVLSVDKSRGFEVIEQIAVILSQSLLLGNVRLGNSASGTPDLPIAGR
jgi:hypothetical protein